jgi:hypothetical protein
MFVHCLLPKRIEPILIIVEPSSMAHSKSALIPIERIISFAAEKHLHCSASRARS